MSFSPSLDLDRLYTLLPASARTRDAQQGYPLKALLAVMAREIGVLEEDLAQLYDNLFIETCEPWAVPYIGDLIGWTPGRDLSGAASQRGQVADAIALRRRKGTAAALEELADRVTAWDTRAVEFFERLATTQNLNHLRPHAPATADLRLLVPIALRNTPFDETARNVDVRSISLGRGTHNIPNVGIFLWPILSVPSTDTPAVHLGGGRCRLDPLGRDVQLYVSPEAETELESLARPINLPMPLTRRLAALDQRSFIGAGRSVSLRVSNAELAPDAILVADLSGPDAGPWGRGFPAAPTIRCLLDPELGRALVRTAAAASTLSATFHTGAIRQMGGGEYQRSSTLVQPEDLPGVAVPATATPNVQAALNLLAGRGRVELRRLRRDTSLTAIAATTDQTLAIRAADGPRPHLVPAGDVVVSGQGSTIVVEGVLISGTTIRVNAGAPSVVRIAHCTIAPQQPAPAGAPDEAGLRLSISVEVAGVRIEVVDSIIGAVRMHAESSLHLIDSIMDSGATVNTALGPLPGATHAGPLNAERSTIIGRVRTRRLEASDTLFAGAAPPGETPVHVERLQEGYARFSYLPPASRAPRSFRCAPPEAAPRFVSLRFGDTGFAQLSTGAPGELRRGGSKAGEIGAMSAALVTLRIDELRARLAEFTRVGMEAGVLPVI